MKTPSVSVLISTHNRPTLVKDAIRSVLDQTYQDFEIVVIDDGTEKPANDSVASFNDDRIRYIAHTEERGCAASRNTGIRNARGKYIAFLDDDDVWKPEKLELQVHAMEAAPSDVGFCFTAVTNVFKDREKATVVPNGIDDYFERALEKTNGFLSVTLFFRREVFDRVGLLDESFPSHTDIAYILRVAKQYRGLGINKPLVRVNMKREHVQMGTNWNRRIIGRKMLIERFRDELEARPAVYAAYMYKLAEFYRNDGRYVEARRTFARGLWLHFDPKYFFKYLSMWFGGIGYRLFRWIKLCLHR